MNGKTSKEKPKMADVTKPKKAVADDGSEPLVIQNRPLIGRATSVSSSVDEEKQEDAAAPEAPASAPILPSQSKRTLIVPISDGEEKEKPAEPAKDNAPSTPEPEAPKAEAADEKPKDARKAASKSDASEQATDKSDDAPEKPAEKATDDKPTDSETEEEVSETDDEADAKDEKPSPETEKAVAEAAAAAKRQKELESLIDSKQFYVPINAVAHKRSIKHSVIMTVLVLVLAIVLIDLMLDSGLILLVQRVPHTHFFTTSSTNN